MLKSGLKIICCFLIAVGLAGCATRNDPQVHLSPAATEQGVCRVAVLPFVNETGVRAAGVQVARIFTSELIASEVYQVEPEGEVYFFLQRNRLKPVDLLEASMYEEMASQLEVDALIRGRVIKMEERKGSRGKVPFCSLQVDLVSSEEGVLLASSYHQGSGDAYQKILHFGTIRTNSGLIAQVSREMIEAWSEKGLNRCSEN